MSTENEVEIDEKGEIIEAKAVEPEDTHEDQEDDAPIKASDDSHDDEEGHAEETDAERAERTERNRARRKENKERRKDYIESLKREVAARDDILAAQQQRLDALERRTQSTDVATVDAEIKKTAEAYNYFKGQINIAVQEQNGAAVADATEKMFQAQRRFDQLNGIKKAVAQNQQTAPALDPRLKANAEGWLEKNNWYDPQAKDQDSFMVRQLDQRLAEEGWNPSTPQYWEELDARVKKYLPHRAKQSYNPNQSGSRPRVPVAGSGRESGGNSNAQGSYRLSADRVQALKDAGMWDDPKQRADAVTRYKQFDRDAARN